MFKKYLFFRTVARDGGYARSRMKRNQSEMLDLVRRVGRNGRKL